MAWGIRAGSDTAPTRYYVAPGEPASRLPAGFRVLRRAERGENGRRRVVILARRTGISFVTPWLACGLYVLVAVMWLIPDRRIEKTLAR